MDASTRVNNHQPLVDLTGPAYTMPWKAVAFAVSAAAFLVFSAVAIMASSPLMAGATVLIGNALIIGSIVAYKLNRGQAQFEFAQILALKEERKPWLKKAAENNYVPAMREYGAIAADIQMLKKAAFLGDKEAPKIINGLEFIFRAIKNFSGPVDELLALKTSNENKAKKFVEICINKQISIFRGEVVEKNKDVAKFFNEKLAQFHFSAEIETKIREAVRQEKPLV